MNSKPPSPTFESWFDNGDLAWSALDKADDYATTEWEVDFIEGLMDKWERYGMGAFLSEAQYTQLCRIAKVPA